MTYCTLNDFFKSVTKFAYSDIEEHPIKPAATCFDPKKYSCFKGMSFETAKQKALEFNLDLYLNTEHDYFGEHPWEINILKTK